MSQSSIGFNFIFFGNNIFLFWFNGSRFCYFRFFFFFCFRFSFCFFQIDVSNRLDMRLLFFRDNSWYCFDRFGCCFGMDILFQSDSFGFFFFLPFFADPFRFNLQRHILIKFFCKQKIQLIFQF